MNHATNSAASGADVVGAVAAASQSRSLIVARVQKPLREEKNEAHRPRRDISPSSCPAKVFLSTETLRPAQHRRRLKSTSSRPLNRMRCRTHTTENNSTKLLLNERP